MKPYVIVSPPFEVTSGGVRVMFGLYGWLLAKGQVAYINEKPRFGDFIAVYPEIQRGNPADATSVVRYILNKVGVVDAIYSDGTMQKGPTEFAPTDKLYYFSRLFGEAKDENHYLFLPILNTHLFKDYGLKRTKTAYFVGKAIKEKDYYLRFKHPSDAILIDRDLAQDQQSLADLLNECEVLYSYDPVSAMTELCRLCGCRVVLLNDTYSQEDYHNKYEPSDNGISFGYDMGVLLDSRKFRIHYLLMKQEFDLKLDKFIEETQK